MSLNSIFNIGVSSLMTSQEQLRVTSDNISNINTPGYIRKIASQESVTIGGVGQGVSISDVRLSTDKYLQSAALKATSAASAAQVSYELLDQLQAQFGDLTDSNTIFNQMSEALTSMAQAAEDPTSSAGRQVVISHLSSFLSEGARISGKIQQLRQDADSRISTDVTSINELLKNISTLNNDISAATVAGTDATGAITTQSQYIDKLSELMDISVTQNSNGGVTLRTQSGLILANDNGYASLAYKPAPSVDSTTTFSPIIVTGVSGETRDLADYLTSGELKGLLETRDVTTVGINDQLNEYLRQFSDSLNAAHNQGSATPAPEMLTGTNTSLRLTEALSGFSGQTHLTTLDDDGNLTHDLLVDFDAMTLTLDGTAVGSFTAATFASDVTSAFGGAASLTYNSGVMKFQASGSSGNDGVAVVDEEGNAASRLGKGFSHTFGLNNLISADVPLTHQTGLTATSDHGFVAGGTVGFTLTSAKGATLAKIDFTMTAGGNMTDLVNALNSTTTGVGRYGTFSFDGSTGELSFKGFGTPANSLGVAYDSTSRLGTGASFSSLFGVGGAKGMLASGLDVNQSISNDPALLSLAKVDLDATGNQSALVEGDGSNGQIMADLSNKTLNFGKAGYNSGGNSTLERYASDLAGQVGNLAATAENSHESNQSLLTEANARRDSVEGVNLDEELINLTTYQQAYTAAGRLIQAAKDMYDVLLNMV